MSKYQAGAKSISTPTMHWLAILSIGWSLQFFHPSPRQALINVVAQSYFFFATNLTAFFNLNLHTTLPPSYHSDSHLGPTYQLLANPPTYLPSKPFFFFFFFLFFLNFYLFNKTSIFSQIYIFYFSLNNHVFLAKTLSSQHNLYFYKFLSLGKKIIFS